MNLKKLIRTHEVDPQWAIASQRRYLLQEMEICAQIASETATEVMYEYCLNDMARIAKELKKLQYVVRKKPQGRLVMSEASGNMITEEMIDRAYQYPIEQLIEFDRAGKALAFCHDDSKPSLSWHRSRNRATCFVCSKSFSPVDVLKERDGMMFRDAVRRLQ